MSVDSEAVSNFTHHADHRSQTKPWRNKSGEISSINSFHFDTILTVLDPSPDLAPSLCASILHRMVLLSVSNNFAGMERSAFHELNDFLLTQTSPDLYQLISTGATYTSKALARNLFKGAIEVGDARVLRTLVQHSKAGINPDNEICVFGGRKYTPIERASSLGHHDVIKVLLQSRVDVNKTYSDFYDICGALNNALLSRSYNDGIESWTCRSVDMRIVRMLLDANADVDDDTIQHMIANSNDDQLILILKKWALRDHVYWSEKSHFHYHYGPAQNRHLYGSGSDYDKSRGRSWRTFRTSTTCTPRSINYDTQPLSRISD